MNVFHGTTSEIRKRIIKDRQIKPSEADLAQNIDAMLNWIDRISVIQDSNISDIPAVGYGGQPPALGNGVYAFEHKADAENFSPEHCVVIIELSDNVQLIDLDDPATLLKIATYFLSNDFQTCFDRRCYSDELRTQYTKIFSLFGEFLIDLELQNRTIRDYPYVFAYTLWFLEFIFDIKYPVVAYTFPEYAKFICIRDNHAIKSIY